MKKENGIMKNEEIYQDKKGYFHLIRDGIDLLKGKNAIHCWSYSNKDYKWQDEKRYFHLMEIMNGKMKKSIVI